VRIRLQGVISVLLLSLCPCIASADPIRLISFDRHVFASALVFGPSGVVAVSDEDRQLNGASSASARAAFGGTTALANSQLSGVTLSDDSQRLTASGFSTASVSGSGGLSQSTADVGFEFEITTPRAFEFIGDFSKDALLSGWQANLRPLLENGNSPGVRFEASSNFGGADQHLRFGGSLDPGHYLLFVRGSAGGDTVFGNSPASQSQYNFAFTMAPTPTPEPTSMLLVGTGVLSLVARARRKRSR
jgi:PEP-CTERM motif-containing protein